MRLSYYKHTTINGILVLILTYFLVRKTENVMLILPYFFGQGKLKIGQGKVGEMSGNFKI